MFITWIVRLCSQVRLSSEGKPKFYLACLLCLTIQISKGIFMTLLAVGAAALILADRIQPAWISNQLCWTSVHGQNIHDLLPLPYTEETVKHVVERINMRTRLFRAAAIIGKRLQLCQLY
ncbi:MAG: putative membrane-anchored protein [Methylophilaceae bacterium]|jgi:uncharacterized membrane-anchored protein